MNSIELWGKKNSTYTQLRMLIVNSCFLWQHRTFPPSDARNKSECMKEVQEVFPGAPKLELVLIALPGNNNKSKVTPIHPPYGASKWGFGPLHTQKIEP